MTGEGKAVISPQGRMDGDGVWESEARVGDPPWRAEPLSLPLDIAVCQTEASLGARRHAAGVGWAFVSVTASLPLRRKEEHGE